MFPDRVGHFMLDAVVPHGLVSPAQDESTSLYPQYFTVQAQDEIAILNRALLRADAYCQNNSRCLFHFKGKGSILKVGGQGIDLESVLTPFSTQAYQ